MSARRPTIPRMPWIACWIACAAACDSKSPEPPPKPESSLALQIQAVHEKRTDTIRLERTVLTRQDLETLADLENLKHLHVLRLRGAPENWDPVRRLGGLRTLRLGGPNVTDAVMERVGKLRSLRYLIVVEAPVTDAGLAHLRGLERLESLYLLGTRVSDAGVDALSEALPDLHLHW